MVYDKEKLIIATFTSVFHVLRSLSNKPYLTEGRLMKSASSVPPAMEELTKVAPLLRDFLLRPVLIEYEKTLTTEYTIQSIGELVVSKLPRVSRFGAESATLSSQRIHSSASQRDGIPLDQNQSNLRTNSAANHRTYKPGRAKLGEKSGLHRPESAVTVGNFVFEKKKSPVQSRELSKQERWKIIQGVSEERKAVPIQEKISCQMEQILWEQELMVKKIEWRALQEAQLRESKTETASSKKAVQIQLKVGGESRPRPSMFKDLSGSSRALSAQRHSLDVPSSGLARPGSRRSIYSSRRPEGQVAGGEPAKSIDWLWRDHEARVKQNSTTLLIDSAKVRSNLEIKDYGDQRLRRANSPSAQD